MSLSSLSSHYIYVRHTNIVLHDFAYQPTEAETATPRQKQQQQCIEKNKYKTKYYNQDQALV